MSGDFLPNSEKVTSTKFEPITNDYFSLFYFFTGKFHQSDRNWRLSTFQAIPPTLVTWLIVKNWTNSDKNAELCIVQYVCNQRT